LIAHDEGTLTVHNRKESFEIRDNKVISVERLDTYEHVDNNNNNSIDEEIDLDGLFKSCALGSWQTCVVTELTPFSGSLSDFAYSSKLKYIVVTLE
jgi:hypothetical protein